ncbi:hypothetical protein LTR04_003640, partial [Oleoguttula sp. CCFEE 6159]
LYHKLHGVHRPVAMKKSEIKRRKRVVPAINDQSTGLPNPGSEPSVSPDPGVSNFSESAFHTHENIDNSLSHVPHQEQSSADYGNGEFKPQRPPYPVDFTDSFRPGPARHRDQNRDIPIPPNPYQQLHTEPNLHKRSFSVSESSDHHTHTHPSSITSILNPSQQTPIDAGNIDPSLAAMEREATKPFQASAPTGTSAPVAQMTVQKTKAERRAELEREAERMREMLVAKEKELAALGEES